MEESAKTIVSSVLLKVGLAGFSCMQCESAGCCKNRPIKMPRQNSPCHGRPRLHSTTLGLNWSRPIEGPSIVSWDVLFVGKSDFPILRSGKEVLFIVQVHYSCIHLNWCRGG